MPSGPLEFSTTELHAREDAAAQVKGGRVASGDARRQTVVCAGARVSPTNPEDRNSL